MTEKVTEGRFNSSQEGRGPVKDLIENENVEAVVCIAKFKDGSLDVFGSMDLTDLCFGVKIIDADFIHYNIEQQSGGE